MLSPEESDKQQASEKIKQKRKKGTPRYTPKPTRKGRNEVYQDQKEENRRKSVRDKRPQERKLRKQQIEGLKTRPNALSKGHSWRKRS